MLTRCPLMGNAPHGSYQLSIFKVCSSKSKVKLIINY